MLSPTLPQSRDRTSLSRVIRCLIVAVAMVSAQAQAGLLGQLAERSIEHGAKHLAERVSQHSSAAPVVPFPAAGDFSSCSHLFPAGAVLNVAVVREWRPLALCANHFAVIHSTVTKTALIVVERLSATTLTDAGGEKRTDEFFADPRLTRGARAELSDYQGSGFDRGHLAPAADQPDPHSMAQSFVLSNMVPQDPTNNRKIWSKIESDVRKFVRRTRGDVFVFTGPLFRGQPRTIGASQVWVPSHLFKLVYDSVSGRAWAYVLPNTATAQIEKPIGYAEFVRQTGWDPLRGQQVAAH